MTFPRYAEYKDSGIAWLGEVPGHWRLVPVKALYRLVKRQEGLDAPVLSVYRDHGVVEKSSRSDNNNKTPEDLSLYQTVLADDIVVNKMKAWQGSLGLSAFFGITSPDYAVFEKNHSEISGYFHYLLRCNLMPDVYRLISNGIRNEQWRLEPDKFLQIKIPLPPKSEQHDIFAFLDREAARIDDLIAEQERLIALVKEKRQAVISHAVTKGLNPAAPMKDSGIDWLGEVPEHWDVFPLKRDLLFLTSGSRGWAEHYSEHGSVFIRIGNLTRESVHLDLSDLQRVAVPEGAEGDRTRVQEGDVLFSITAYLGSVAVVPEYMETAYVSQHIALARLRRNRLVPLWVAYQALSFVGKTYLETQGYGGTKIQLSLDDVANMLMLVPPCAEQHAIVAHLDAETAKLDALVAEAERAIALLREHRAALISAAVTGKIDVRGLVDAEAVA